jgi:hypothetical protein
VSNIDDAVLDTLKVGGDMTAHQIAAWLGYPYAEVWLALEDLVDDDKVRCWPHEHIQGEQAYACIADDDDACVDLLNGAVLSRAAIIAETRDFKLIRLIPDEVDFMLKKTRSENAALKEWKRLRDERTDQAGWPGKAGAKRAVKTLYNLCAPIWRDIDAQEERDARAATESEMRQALAQRADDAGVSAWDLVWELATDNPGAIDGALKRVLEAREGTEQ